jgi:hypothetical protein
MSDKSRDRAPCRHSSSITQLMIPSATTSGILRDKELEIEAPALAVDSVDVVGGYTGELIIAVASIPAIAQVLVAWVQRKPGRTVRVEFHPSGKVKTVEAKTEEQVLSIVNALDQEARARASKAKKK